MTCKFARREPCDAFPTHLRIENCRSSPVVHRPSGIMFRQAPACGIQIYSCHMKAPVRTPVWGVRSMWWVAPPRRCKNPDLLTLHLISSTHRRIHRHLDRLETHGARFGKQGPIARHFFHLLITARAQPLGSIVHISIVCLAVGIDFGGAHILLLIDGMPATRIKCNVSMYEL